MITENSNNQSNYTSIPETMEMIPVSQINIKDKDYTGAIVGTMCGTFLVTTLIVALVVMHIAKEYFKILKENK